MKRTRIWIAAAVLAPILLFCAYQEAHFASYTNEYIPITEEAAQRECPEIVLTEADQALKEAVLALPEVQTALRNTRPAPGESDKSGPWRTQSIPPSVSQVLEPLFPVETFDRYYLDVSAGNVISLDLFCAEDLRIIWSFFADDSYPTSKTVGVYTPILWNRDRNHITIYTNDLHGITKMVDKRLWFSWLDSFFSSADD